MYRRIIYLISFVLLSLGISGSSPVNLSSIYRPDTDEKRVNEVFDVSAGQKLTVNLKIGGDIDVSGWEKEQVSVKVLIKGDDAEEIEVDFDQSSSGIDIYAEYIGDGRSYDANVTFTIKVPSRFDVEFSTMGGDTELKNVAGKLEGTTMGGDILLHGLKGNLETTSMGGDITLSVPEELSMELDLDIAYDSRHEDEVEIVSDFEFYEERKEEWDNDNSPKMHIYGTGTVNGGKNKIKIKTINGKIFLNKN